MRDKYMFSDAQALGALTSTGVVSTNVFDMELEEAAGNVIIEDDQLVGVLNLTIPANAAQVAGDSGMNIYLRSGDNNDMVTSAIDLGVVFVSQAELLAGCIKNIKVLKQLTQKFVGVFYDPVSETLTTGNTVDAYWDTEPLTANDSVQKVPAARS